MTAGVFCPPFPRCATYLHTKTSANQQQKLDAQDLCPWLMWLEACMILCPWQWAGHSGCQPCTLPSTLLRSNLQRILATSLGRMVCDVRYQHKTLYLQPLPSGKHSSWAVQEYARYTPAPPDSHCTRCSSHSVVSNASAATWAASASPLQRRTLQHHTLHPYGHSGSSERDTSHCSRNERS
jgi:hypothetical protein